MNTNKENNMSKIDYNHTTLSLINELSIINPSMILDKVDGDVVIKSSSADRSVAYIFTAPEDHFGFEGDECAFYNYGEFYKLFSVMDQPSVKQNGSDLVMSKDRSTMKYRLSKSEIIPRGFNSVEFEDPDVEVRLSAEYLKKLYTFVSNSMLNANRLKLKGEGRELTLTLENSKSPNSFSEVIELENEVGEEFEFVISTSIFQNLPSNLDFTFSIKEEGIVEFKLITETGVSLELYTAELVEDDD